ncbi:sigma-70 family RNA polymerase sigma factor [Bacillus sp. ISL-53]|nr:sigma-70 family RNA polymerase sigma factor [Bacillus sp. ISL-53]
MTAEMENQVVEWIRDYNFMLREIARLNRLLNSVHIGQKLTATYGIEATLPKGNGGISQAELRQMDIRERRLFRYEMIIEFLETASEDFNDERQEIIFDCMIEGMSYSSIAIHLGCSRDTVREVKNVIIGNIVNKVKNDCFLQKLKSVKLAV